jgi:aspartyl-tRNA(Asn)/glutamyl-tRNA(Gln) amidotransferase subunit A
LQAAVTDAERRGLAELTPLLEGLARSTALLRAADFGPHADGSSVAGAGPGDVRLAGPEPNTVAAGEVRGTFDPEPPPQSIEALGRRLRSGAISAVEILETCLRNIEAWGTRLNAFILTTGDVARQQAIQADAELSAGQDRGPLHGIPISLKDLIDVEGQRTTAASLVRARHVAAASATVVTRLRHAGAVIVGKTNLHEFAFGTTNEDSAFGPARHPSDTSRSPGGSSGGSAVSIAAGMAVASLGTDTGGSIRIPAAACGLVGLKPSLGDVPTDGVVPLSKTLDHVGPLAGSVTDVWHVYRAICGQHDAVPLRPAVLDEMRLAVPRRYFCDLLEPGVRACFDGALERLRREGARIAEAEIGHADRIAAVYLQIVLSEAAAVHAATLETVPDQYTAPVRQRLEMARYVLAEDYLRAREGREVLRAEVDRALDGHHALVLPTLPIVAPRLGETTASLDGTAYPVRNLMLRLTQLFNVTGHPAVSLPCGVDASGLPVGLQLVGRRGQAPELLTIARGIERALGDRSGPV